MGAKFNQVEVTTPAAAAAHSPRKDQMETAISAAVDAAVDDMDAALADGLAGKANATMAAIRTLLSGGNGTLDFSGFTVTLPEGMLIQFRSGTQEELDEADPLAVAEPAWTTDSKILYIGTGATNQPVLMANLVGGAGYQVVANKFQFTSATDAVKFTASGFAFDTLIRADGPANAGGLGTVSASGLIRVMRGAGGTGAGTVRAGGAIYVYGACVESGAAAASAAGFAGGNPGQINVTTGLIDLKAGASGAASATAAGGDGGSVLLGRVIRVMAGYGGVGGMAGSTGGVGGSINTNDGLILFESGTGAPGNNQTINSPGGPGSFAGDYTPRIHFKGGSGGVSSVEGVTGARGGYTGRISFKAGGGSEAFRGGDCGSITSNAGFAHSTGGRGGDGGSLNLDGTDASLTAPGIDGGGVNLTGGVNTITTSKSGGGHVLTFPNYADGPLALAVAPTKIATTNYIVGADNDSEPFGGLLYVSNASNLYLPHAESGMSMKVILTAAVAVNIVPMSTAKIYLNGVALDDGDEIEASTLNANATITAYDGDWWVISSGFADGGVGTQWSPADLGADLVLGVRGTLGNTVNTSGGTAADGETVKWFANTYAGNAKNTAGGGVQPIQRTNGLQFDGVDDYLEIGPVPTGAATPLEIKFDGPYTVFGVVNLNAGSDMTIVGSNIVSDLASVRYVSGALAVVESGYNGPQKGLAATGGVTPFFVCWPGPDKDANMIDSGGRELSFLPSLPNPVCHWLGGTAEYPASHADNRFLLFCAVDKQIAVDSYEFDRLNDYLLTTFGVALPGA